MTEIYLIRHTQAEGNRYRIMQGHWDGDITALGERQIELLAERFRDVPVTAVYSSDLYRARRTAEAAARWRQLPIQTDKRLREINIGPWETAFFGNLLHDEPEQVGYFLHEPERFSLAGAETFAQVGERALQALEEIARLNEGGVVAVVSHGVTIRCLLSRITGIALEETEALPICRNTAVTHLLWDGERFTLDFFNDDSHLDTLAAPHWNRNNAVRHERLDPGADAEYYTACYADAWRCAHGDLEGFSAPVYLRSAQAHHRADPDSVLRMLIDEEPIGLVDMDTRRGALAGYGWLTLLYLKPEYRGQGYGIQLLGRVYRKYQQLGRRSVRLTVAVQNQTARDFYAREGFVPLGYERGRKDLLLLERKLGGPRHG